MNRLNLFLVGILIGVIICYVLSKNKESRQNIKLSSHDTIYVHDTVFYDSRFKIEGQSTDIRMLDKKKPMSLDKK